MNRKHFVAYFIARENDPDLSMRVSVNINVANGYFNDAMVLFVPLYGTISPCLCTRTFSRCSRA